MARSSVAHASGLVVNWNYFVSACILMGGLLLKLGAPLPAVLAGMVLAGLWNWKGPRLRR